MVDTEVFEQVAQITDQLEDDEVRELHRVILARLDPRRLPYWAVVVPLFTRPTYRYGPGTTVSTDTLMAIGAQVIARRRS